MKSILALIALAPLGCSVFGSFAPGDSRKVWAKANAGYAGLGDYERAEASCRTADGLPAVAAGPQRSQEFVDCMRRHQWVLVRRP